MTLARRLGWSVFNRYGVVMLYDPLQLFKEQGAAVTLISETYTLAKSALDEERSLLEFDPSEEAESSCRAAGLQGRLLQRRAAAGGTAEGDALQLPLPH